jgi:SAM-dependent methyltransferase
MGSYTRQQLEDWLKTIDVRADRVLDVGGAQNPVKGRTKSWEVNEYKILDLAHPRICIQKPDIICDLNETELQGEVKLDYFDIAFCLEVSEYWWNPKTALDTINHLIKPGGILYISFHFVYPRHYPLGKDYLRYTPEGVEKLLKETGFEIIDHLPRLSTEPFYGLDEMKVAKELDHHQVGSLIKAKKL